MLRKLLKYDLRSIFRLWWIVAAISVGLAVLGGFALRFTDNSANVPDSIVMAANIVIFFAFFAMAGLALLTLILLFIRYYRNFFTDEGYLTFTLPVKRETLFNSKVLTGIISMAATVGVCMLNGFIMNTIQYPETEFYEDIGGAAADIPDEWVGYVLTYCLEGLIIFGLLILLSVLFLYCCITFGSMIVKKGKLFASIGIYYGACSLFTTTVQLMLILGAGSIGVWLSPMSEQLIPSMVAWILLAVILLLAAFCALFYAFTHWMLDRKLNLS